MDNIERRLTEARNMVSAPDAARSERIRKTVLDRGPVAKVPEPARRRHRRLIGASAAVVAGAAAVAIGLFGLGGSGTNELSLSKAAAAVDSTGQIEHSKWIQDGVQYEQWTMGGGSSRTIATPPVKGAHPAVAVTPAPCSLLTPEDCKTMGASLAELLRSDRAHITGTNVDNGREVTTVTLNKSPESQITGTYEIDTKTLLPVSLDLTGPGGERASFTYQTYELLPPTEANLALLH